MTTSLHLAVAQAVATDLEGGSWSQQISPAAKWRVRYQLTELKELKVSVLPGPSTVIARTRGRDQEKYTSDIVVQKQVNPDDLTAVDALVVLAEEFRAYFRNKSLTAGTRNMRCVDPREFLSPDKAGMSKDLLEDDQVFNCCLRLNWEIVGAP